MSTTVESKSTKKLPKNSVKLQFAGDLILARCPEQDLSGLFKRFEAIFESYANMEKMERILNYKLLNALMITSYAKKAPTVEEKRNLFAMKNKIFLSLAGNPDYRRLLSFRYLVSKNFRVTKYCESCVTENKETREPKHKWKHCRECEVDRNFYNIVSMNHQYPKGYSRIYLSNDQLSLLPFGKPKIKGKLDDSKEEALFGKYHYNSKNLDAIDFQSVMKMYEKFINK